MVGIFLNYRGVVVVVMSILLLSLVGGQIYAQDSPEDTYIDELANKAEGYEVSQEHEKALMIYQHILKIRPNSIKNLPIDFRIAELYHYVHREGVRPNYGMAVTKYNEIISKYPAVEPLVIRSHLLLSDIYKISGYIFREVDEYNYILDLEKIITSQPDNYSYDTVYTVLTMSNLVRERIGKPLKDIDKMLGKRRDEPIEYIDVQDIVMEAQSTFEQISGEIYQSIKTSNEKDGGVSK